MALPVPDPSTQTISPLCRHEPDRRTARVRRAETEQPASPGAYWIANLEERCLEVYREPNHKGHAHSQRIAHGDGVSPQHFADVLVDVVAILR
jgi:hypothetical protein